MDIKCMGSFRKVSRIKNEFKQIRLNRIILIEFIMEKHTSDFIKGFETAFEIYIKEK